MMPELSHVALSGLLRALQMPVAGGHSDRSGTNSSRQAVTLHRALLHRSTTQHKQNNTIKHQALLWIVDDVCQVLRVRTKTVHASVQFISEMRVQQMKHCRRQPTSDYMTLMTITSLSLSLSTLRTEVQRLKCACMLLFHRTRDLLQGLIVVTRATPSGNRLTFANSSCACAVESPQLAWGAVLLAVTPDVACASQGIAYLSGSVIAPQSTTVGSTPAQRHICLSVCA